RDIAFVKIETEGGGVVTTGISGRLEAETGGGSIHLDDIGGAISAETGGGSVDVGNVGGDLAVQTGGGGIHIGSAKGKVAAESGGGSIELWGVPAAHVETGAGAITAKFIASGERSDSLLETGVGDVTVYLVPNINITVRASIEAATGHRIISDFPEIKVSSEGG